MLQVASIFSQLLQQFPRALFQKIVVTEDAERHAKGFRCWDQFIAMLFCHIAQADSLREICNGLKSCCGKLIHIGVTSAPKRSTLAYANEHRTALVYEQLFYQTYDRFRSEGKLGFRKRKFRFKNKLLSLDSTTISLCLSIFPWAQFRRAKGGVKLHVLLDHDHYMPEFVAIREAKRHDVTIAKSLTINRGSIVAMDRAYNDFSLFSKWIAQGIWFVTRMKENTQYRVVKILDVPNRRNILSDHLIVLTGTAAPKTCPHVLRRIVVWDDEKDRAIVLLTNHLTFGSTTVSSIYKERWEIEIFFKTLKQILKVKSFVGTSENALRIQIWTALIALLLFKWLHHVSMTQWSFSNLVSLLRLNLFLYRDLQDWLNDPFQIEPDDPIPHQLLLPLPGLGQQRT